MIYSRVNSQQMTIVQIHTMVNTCQIIYDMLVVVFVVVFVVALDEKTPQKRDVAGTYLCTYRPPYFYTLSKR